MSSYTQLSGRSVTIMAGGTGGHVFPALAVADRLKELGCSVSWIGTAKGIEHRVVPEAGYPLRLIPVSGLRGKGIKSLILAPFQLIRALIASLRILSELKPDLVLGFGGFVAGPVGLAARLRRDSLAIHEQNAKAGTTNKILARWADVVMTGFPSVFESSAYVGNPVRANIKSIDESAADEASDTSLNILILGGSQGARSLNQMVPSALLELGTKHSLNVRHQCGPRWLEETNELYGQSSLEVEVIPFIEDMSQAYAWSDLVICRSGAMTVAELAIVGRPALFIPFPYAIDDHQTANAMWLCDLGAAELMQESAITQNSLVSRLDHLIDYSLLAQMSKASAAVAMPDATETIVGLCEELVNVH